MEIWLNGIFHSKARYEQSLRSIRMEFYQRNAPSYGLLINVDSVGYELRRNRLLLGAAIKNILQVYAQNYGQLVNFEKSRVVFGSNVIESNKSDVRWILEVSSSNCPEKYLGMSATLLWKMEAIMERFSWSHNHSKRGIHWCTWSKLSCLKEEGGMCFRDMGKFNIALLDKQGWRFLLNSNSLVARYMEREGVFRLWDVLENWHMSFGFHMERFLVTGARSKKKIFAISIWAMWFSRNRLVHEGILQREKDVITFVRGYLHELNSLTGNCFHAWAPICSRYGLFSFYHRRGARTIVERVHSAESDLSDIKSLITDIKVKEEEFRECHFHFIPRHAYQVAHALSSRGLKESSDLFWVEDAPPSILSLAIAARRHLEPT
ncbi:hypothetical protein F3Y22_tig00112243pilonHSYRG00060 [Hibiscus syriacus]|uniref:RNase H type-1 domain-containing protein n=1 Tax=Hibiscus syriacus TaxID=106335 RepID=A0A6A2X376_HIBSY|nr:hypothetical protein F3Y22_tig00112243pilonHSYRG00060 [Hibiscus syriacus]